MHSLIVVSHPDQQSLSVYVANQLAAGLEGAHGGYSAEVAHLELEGFDQVFTLEDRQAYLSATGHPEDVLREQARIERAQHLILVFPVWWWSVPGMLKGWIDRVFAHGWAFGYDPKASDTLASSKGLLRNLTIHLVPIASGTESSYDRHGYAEALRTQIEHGVVDYCGAKRGITEYLWESETRTNEQVEARLAEILERLLLAVGEHSTT